MESSTVIMLLFLTYCFFCEHYLLDKIKKNLYKDENILFILKCPFILKYITPFVIASILVYIPSYTIGKYDIGNFGAFLFFCNWLLMFFTLYHMSTLQVITDKRIFRISSINFFNKYDQNTFGSALINEITNIKHNILLNSLSFKNAQGEKYTLISNIKMGRVYKSISSM